MTDIINSGERMLLEKESHLVITRHLYAYNTALGLIAVCRK